MRRKYFKNAIIGIMLGVVCTGCSSVSHLEISESPVVRPALLLVPTPIALEPVIVTVRSIDGVLFYTMDSENFLRETRNDLKILQLMDEQRRIIEAYKEYYEIQQK